jgi:ABC-2 type transport system ATP-binding protein
MLEVQSLTKRFGPILAVDDVSFTVSKGEVLGFLGPNGAGKSTTMKMVTGFLSPTAGTAIVCGHDIQEEPIAAKRCIGYLPEGAPLYPDMTAHSFLGFTAAIRGLSGSARSAAIDRAISLTELQQVINQPIDTLSKGFKRRVGLAQALVHDPEVLVLDEPTDGLDPNQKHQVRQIIHEMAAEKTIIISTHILEEVDAVCSRALIIASGRIVADGTPGELEARSPIHNAVTVRLRKTPPAAELKALGQISGVASVESLSELEAPAYRVIPAEGAAILHPVSQYISEKKWEIEEIHLEKGHLDDVFRSVTTGREAAAA